jgi:hypothetical protein
MTGIINKPLLLHLVGCLYYLYQRCAVRQISDNEIYLLNKYIKSVLWRVAKRLSYKQDARCLKVKKDFIEMHCDDNWIEVALDLGTGFLWQWCCSYLSYW